MPNTAADNAPKTNRPSQYVQTTMDRYFVKVKSQPGASTASNSAIQGCRI